MKSKDSWINIRLSDDEKKRLIDLADQNERTLAAQARIYIREGIAREATEPIAPAEAAAA